MITIGIFQAFLFTFALTTLIDVYFFTWRRFIREVIIILLPTLAAFMVLFICSNHYGFIAFLLLALFYLIKLVCYIVNFRNRYHDYERNISNYFSDDEHHRLEWVKNSCGSVFGLYKQLIHRRKHNTFKIERYKKVQ